MCDVVSKQIREYFPEDDFQSDGKLHIESYVVKMLETETGKNKNECREKCNEDPDCNMFSITKDNICKTIETCNIENVKLLKKRQTTYKKLQGS